MDSVAVDVFAMPISQLDRAVFDCFVACVDRLSGWFTTIPMARKGLTASAVAKKMYRGAWSRFWLPTDNYA